MNLGIPLDSLENVESAISSLKEEYNHLKNHINKLKKILKSIETGFSIIYAYILLYFNNIH